MFFDSVIKKICQFEIEANFLFHQPISKSNNYPNLSNFKMANQLIEIKEINFGFQNDIDLLKALWEKGNFQYSNSNEKLYQYLMHLDSLGDRCFVIKIDDIFIGMQWISGDKSELFDKFGNYLKNVQDIKVQHRLYILPKYRGRTLQNFLHAELKRRLSSEGFKGLYTFVGVNNFASIRNCLKLYEDYKLLYYLAISFPRNFRLHFYLFNKKEPWKKCSDNFPQWQPSKAIESLEFI